VSNLHARPEFGKPKKLPEYYSQVRTFVHALRATMTYQAIAVQLNRAGFQTPMDKPWDKQAVANVMRNTSI
jgi:hypothetical protein